MHSCRIQFKLLHFLQDATQLSARPTAVIPQVYLLLSQFSHQIPSEASRGQSCKSPRSNSSETRSWSKGSTQDVGSTPKAAVTAESKCLNLTFREVCFFF